MTHFYQWLRRCAAAFSAAAVAFAIAGPVQAQNQPPQAPSAKAVKDNAKEDTKGAKESAKDSANQAKDAADQNAQKATPDSNAAKDRVTNDSANRANNAAKDSSQSATNQTNKNAQTAKENANDAGRDARNRAAQQSNQNSRETQARDNNAQRDSQQRDDRNAASRDNQSRDNRDVPYQDRQHRDNQYRDLQNRDGQNSDSRRRDTNGDSTFRASDVRSADIGLWFDRSARDGLVISDIASQGAIAKLGFHEGDRIVSVNGQRVARDNDFIQYLFADNVRNDRVKVVVLRDNQEEVVYVQPNALVEEYSNVQNDPLEQFGVVVDDRYDDRIVVWKVISRSPAYYAGIRAGDVLVTFRGQPLASRQDFVRVVTNLDEGSVPVQVQRGDRTRDYAVEVPNFDSRAERRTAMRPNIDVERPNENREGRIEDRRETRVENRNDNRPATPLRPRR